MVGVAQAREQMARGVVLGVADDGNADAEQRGHVAFRDGLESVIGALGVDVGVNFAEKMFYVELVENYDVVHKFQRGDERRTRTLGENWAAFAFQFSGTGIGIDSDDEKIAFLFCGLQVANVADVQQIEDAIREHNFAAGMAMLIEDAVQTFAGNNFFASIHSNQRPAVASRLRAASSSSRVTVAVRRFITTMPPA